MLLKVEFDTKGYIDSIKKSNQYFHTFLNRENLAVGVLVLQPGEKDTQMPHESDEIYYILKGNGKLKINKKDYSISEGKVFYVPRGIEHHFFENTRELIVFYFFGGSDS